MKLPYEVCSMITDFAVIQPKHDTGPVPMTTTLTPPAVTQVSCNLRNYTLPKYYKDRIFAIQVSRNTNKCNEVESLQSELMYRWLEDFRDHPRKVKQMLLDEADKVMVELEDILETSGNGKHLLHYRYIESIRVVFAGRFRINRTGYLHNWAPRSCIVGFKACKGGQMPRGESPSGRRQLNKDDDLDWEDFEEVRYAYARVLRRIDSEFDDLEFSDVLLHPAVQQIVKELCLLAAANAPAMEYVEVVLEDYNCGSIIRDQFRLPHYDPEGDTLDDLSPLPSEVDEDEEEEEEEEEEEDEEEDEEEEEVEEEEEEEGEEEASEDDPEPKGEPEVGSQDKMIVLKVEDGSKDNGIPVGDDQSKDEAITTP